MINSHKTRLQILLGWPGLIHTVGGYRYIKKRATIVHMILLLAIRLKL